MPVVGSRFLIEAGFIIAVAVIAGIERLSTWWIIAVVASAWIIVAIVEIVVWARQVVAHQSLVPELELSEPQPQVPTVAAPAPVRASVRRRSALRRGPDSRRAP